MQFWRSWTFAVSDEHRRAKRIYVGEKAHLNCGYSKTSNGSVDWHFCAPCDADVKQIISGGYLTNGDFGGRLKINGSTLVIDDAQTSDSGIYTCVKDGGLGTRHRMPLSVQGKIGHYIFLPSDAMRK